MARIHRLGDWPAELREAAARSANSGHSIGGLLCPVCAGGRSKERSLSVWVDGRYAKAHCWRAGCGYSADAPLSGDIAVGPVTFKPRNYEGALEPLPADIRGHFAFDYGLDEDTLEHFGVLALERRFAVYMPVWGRESEPRGAMVRYFDGTQPKAVSYKATDLPWQAWYESRLRDTPCVIVEDQISAMRLYQLGYLAVALLGTNLNEAKATEIRVRAGDRKVLLALDADTTTKAIGYARKYPWMQVRRLDCDIKDMTDDGTIWHTLEGSTNA